ncbi:MAG: hypothetical protein HUK17_02810 [Bacteroidales bacterium]|nr:hypothetical protein [Bacteroidales bacterium]MCF0211810.1 hypothetical protein [Bacteroidales bacterium]
MIPAIKGGFIFLQRDKKYQFQKNKRCFCIVFGCEIGVRREDFEDIAGGCADPNDGVTRMRIWGDS